MAATTVARVKVRLGISPTSTGEDVAIGFLIDQIQALIERHLGYPIERAIRTEYHEGTDDYLLSLRSKPAWIFPLTATYTEGLTTVTATFARGQLLEGMPVFGEDVPAGATVASFDTDAGTFELSDAAQADGTDARLLLGMHVWHDIEASYGQGTDDFDDDTLLTPGTDYELRLDAPTDHTRSDSALVFRAQGWPRLYRRRAGMLSPHLGGPIEGRGTIKVTYACGWPAHLIPADLQLAIADVIGLARAAAPDGRLLQSEHFRSYGYQYGELGEAAWLGYLGGMGGKILALHRRLPI